MSRRMAEKPDFDLEKHIKKERNVAKALRKTNWWHNILQKGFCHYCGKIFSPTELTMDHIVPLSRGGSSTKGNIVPSCKSCNTIKRTSIPAEIIIDSLENNE
jgi:5-methylcytosine-specific restriction enzyme A